MKFKFKLTPVLNIRSHRVKVEKQKLASLLSEISVLQIELNRRMDKIKLLFEERDQSDGFSQALERALSTHLLIQHEQIEKLKNKLTNQKKKVRKQRKVVLESNKQVQIIEKLKKKALYEHMKEIQRKEQIFQNEIAVQMFMKNR